MKKVARKKGSPGFVRSIPAINWGAAGGGTQNHIVTFLQAVKLRTKGGYWKGVSPMRSMILGKKKNGNRKGKGEMQFLTGKGGLDISKRQRGKQIRKTTIGEETKR